MGRFAGLCRGRFDSDCKIHLKSGLSEVQVGVLRSLGFREVRDPGFSRGRGKAYMTHNTTGESSRHFILWNLIFDEARKYTQKVEYNLTRLPDVIFGLEDGRWIAVEVEATRKSRKKLEPKLEVLKRYDEWFFVVTDYDNLEHYRQFGHAFTRTWANKVIAAYFGAELKPEPKTRPQ